MSRELTTADLLGIPFKKDTTWYVFRDGKEIGPLTNAALLAMAESGQVGPDDFVREAGGEWVKASEAPILSLQFSQPNQVERPPLETVLQYMVRYQTQIAVAFLAFVILTGIGIGFYSRTPASHSTSNPLSVAGTTWRGSETLENFGYLRFDFRSNGTVIMTDAARKVTGNVEGKWSQRGSSVTIQFSNCRYQGTIQNSVLSGTATMPQQGRQWSFTVSKQ
jgi:hypothetical protein